MTDTFAGEPKETERRLINRFTHENMDGRFSREFAATLEEVPIKQLVDYLAYVKLATRIRGIRLAFATRVDRERYIDRFEMILAKFALAPMWRAGRATR
jgi:hypothetical protein